MNILKVVIEKDDTDEIGGSIQSPGHFLLTTVGNSEQEVIDNLKALVADFIAHEGINYAEWNGVDAYKITYEVEYDLTSFFALFGELKINRIAKLAGINETLLRQYASGFKTASADQVAKVQKAIHQLAERLAKVTLIPN
ncbi:hypothetical protein GCM10028819_32370 [Spirosoma humi]